MQKLDDAGIGMRIRKARKEKGLSQGRLAKECGICLSFMGHIERGTRCMSLETFANICKVLDTDTDWILWGTQRLPAAVLDMWNLSLPDSEKQKKMEEKTEGNNYDSYEMYVKIMKSVAEIMNGN